MPRSYAADEEAMRKTLAQGIYALGLDALSKRFG